MSGLVMPHKAPEPREPWWMAPVGFVVAGAFGGGALALWFAERLA